MMPSAIAATPDRSMENVSLVPELCRVTGLPPSNRSFPAITSDKNNSPVGDECSPIFRMGLVCVSPSMPVSSTKFMILRSFGSTPASSSLQMKIMVSA